MPIFNGTSTKNQAAISLGGQQIGKVYVGDKLVWEKPSAIYQVKYGLLYNWWAATDVRNIAASGWHISTRTEWDTMIAYLGNENVVGGQLKETGLTYWNTPNTGATNSAMMNIRGSGYRGSDGLFAQINELTLLATSTAFGTTQYRLIALTLSSASALSNYIREKSHGSPVRLVKDSTTLTHGQSGTYTGNDGKVYRTICIGTQEWLADNLAETKYRNGDTISEVTDNTAWAALTTGALCAYNNDWNNV